MKNPIDYFLFCGMITLYDYAPEYNFRRMNWYVRSKR